ncbi:uncharacterized protein LOC133202796 [Saccostrea echinata]|uniref:uncharacterized protein LOC133202796 n=1 Tax=Saccostrea echinata TaxID=191078 RepID=UPI002A8009E1|nr:uncharacterized protein LOC133202796 [Saccostrea echinata]
MTINPTLGHLYHDFSISNAYTALDAQELFKTRQRNAREKRQLDEFNRYLNKAQEINLRRLDLEEKCVRHQLADINLRSASLRNGLRHGSLRRSQTFSVASHSTQSSAYPSICTSAAPSRFSGSPSQVSGTSSLGTGDLQLSRSKSNMFVRKVNNVTKSLCKLYEKQQRRKIEKEILLRNVRKNNEELLQKSRVHFKDSDTTQNLEKILGDSSEPCNEFIKQDTLGSIPSTVKMDTAHSETISLPSLTNAVSLNKDVSRTQFSEDTRSNVVQPSMSDDIDLSEFKVNAQNKRTIPDVWQLYKQKMAVDEDEIKEPLLVTITARYRRTLVH